MQKTQIENKEINVLTKSKGGATPRIFIFLQLMPRVSNVLLKSRFSYHLMRASISGYRSTIAPAP